MREISPSVAGWRRSDASNGRSDSACASASARAFVFPGRRLSIGSGDNDMKVNLLGTIAKDQRRIEGGARVRVWHPHKKPIPVNGQPAWRDCGQRRGQGAAQRAQLQGSTGDSRADAARGDQSAASPGACAYVSPAWPGCVGSSGSKMTPVPGVPGCAGFS